MNKKFKHSTLALAALVIIALGLSALAVTSAKAANTSYYVDCVGGNDTNNGTSSSTPWKTLTKVTATTFGAGDSILFKRGVTCSGLLWPKGSGTAASPITIGAYGTGALPIINGGTNEEAIKIFDQSGWHVQDIETTGGNKYGIYIGANGSNTYSHFRVTNVVVHDVSGSASGKESGLIFIGTMWGKSALMQDIIVDGATAYNTGQWNGIRITCTGSMTSPANQAVTIRNSSVHTVAGDGIVIYSCSNGLIENTVAYDTGNIATDRYGTPNSTWTWSCKDCTVQFNEAYDAMSPSGAGDGGAYDIDYPAINNTVQYNYAHDNRAFCVAVYGAEDAGTINSVVRYNVCSNNGLINSVYGDFYFLTWNGGWLDGVKVYNNTSYWTPVAVSGWESPAVCNGCIDGWPPTWQGTLPNLFKNNIIISTGAYLVWNVPNTLQFDNNLYWYTGAGSPKWVSGTDPSYSTYTSLSAWQSATGQDVHSLYANPMVNDYTYHANGMPVTSFTLMSNSPAINTGTDVGGMGSRDFFGNAIPQGSAYDIGAAEYTGSGGPTLTPTNTTVPPTVTYTPHPPTVTFTPTTGPSPTPTNTPVPPTVTSTPGGATVMHVADMYTTDSAGNLKTSFVSGETVYWRVKIVDQYGNPVSGASVDTNIKRPTGANYISSQKKTTDATGWTTPLFSKSISVGSTPGTWTINMNGVTKTGATYDSSANVISSFPFTDQ